MMTAEEYGVIANQKLEQLPKAFRSAVSYYAYEHGHSSGYEEVLLYIDDLIDALAPCINDFANEVLMSKDNQNWINKHE